MLGDMMNGITRATQAKDSMAENREKANTPFIPAVLGGKLFTLFYCALAFIAFGLFLATAVSICVTAATGKITSVNLALKEELPFPAVWMCLKNETMDVVEWNFPPQGANEQCQTIERENQAPESFQLLALKIDNNLATTEECVNMGTGTTLTNWLQTKLGALSASKWQCFSFNEDGKLKDSRTKPLLIMFKGKHTFTAETKGKGFEMPSGFVSVDQLKRAAGDDSKMSEVFNANINPVYIDVFNTLSVVQHTVDQVVDLTGQLGFSPRTEFKDGDEIQSMYQGNSFGRKMDAYPSEDDKDRDFEIQWRTQTFFVREVLLRHKSFQEVWTEIGGAWSTAMLLLSLFFVSHSVQKNGQYTTVQKSHFLSQAMQEKQMKEAGFEEQDTEGAGPAAV